MFTLKFCWTFWWNVCHSNILHLFKFTHEHMPNTELRIPEHLGHNHRQENLPQLWLLLHILHMFYRSLPHASYIYMYVEWIWLNFSSLVNGDFGFHGFVITKDLQANPYLLLLILFFFRSLLSPKCTRESIPNFNNFTY